jgi:predicted MFS family arabinose efflux permease
VSARYRTLVTQITVWHVAASICFYSVYAGTSLFRDAFDLDGVTVGVLITALTLGYAIFLLPLGAATDRFGEHRILTLGLLGLAGGAFLIVLAPTYPLVLVACFVLGAMYGTATPGTNKAIFDNVAPDRQYRAIGIKQVGSTAGSAISAVLVTGLVGVVFWKMGFLVAAVVGTVVAVAFYLTYSGAGAAATSKPDFRGLLSRRPVLLVLVAGVCIGAGVYTTTGYTVLYVEDAVGASVATGGLVLAILQVTASVGKPVAGWLADVVPGRSRTVTAALLGGQTLVAGGLFVAVTVAGTPLQAGLLFAALGFFALGSTGLYYAVLSTIVAEDELGTASALGQFAVTLGGLLAPPVFGYLVDTGGYAAAWLFLGALSVLATGLVGLVAVTGPGRGRPA